MKMHSFTIIFEVELNVRYSVNMDYEYISMRMNCVIIGTLKIKREMTSKLQRNVRDFCLIFMKVQFK